MSLFGKLFARGEGSGSGAAVEPEEYNGYTIFAEPARDGSRWRVGARIEKEISGELQVHEMIRADTLDDHATAVTMSSAKARQMIDQLGDRLFR